MKQDPCNESKCALTVQLRAWHEAFGTSQLSHAIEQVESYKRAIRRAKAVMHDDGINEAYTILDKALKD